MRVHARLVLGLFGLALAVPAWVVAAPPGDGDPAASEEVSPQPPPHPHNGLFGWRHCVICQRACAKAESGVNVPPPPSIGPAAGMQGPVAAMHDHAMIAAGATCPACQGQVVMTGPSTIIDNHVPGYAVVGGSGADCARLRRGGWARWSGLRSGPDRRRQEFTAPVGRPPDGRDGTSTGLESV